MHDVEKSCVGMCLIIFGGVPNWCTRRTRYPRDSTITAAQLRKLLECYSATVVRGLKRVLIMLRDASLSDSCVPDRCRFSGVDFSGVYAVTHGDWGSISLSSKPSHWNYS